jgi:hypothetical protein
MHHRTKKKLDSLRLYIRRNFKRWHKKYPNITGAYPGEKHIGGEPSGKYSIVFLVSNKQKKPLVMIPSYLTVTLPGEGQKKIPTDVRKMEKMRLRNPEPGDKIKRSALSQFGSIGVFVQQNQDVFACTNSHVLLPEMIQNGDSFFFRTRSQQITPDVVLIDQDGNAVDAFLQAGHFDDIDVAIARIADPSVISNQLPGLGTISGLRKIESNDVGLSIKMVGLMSGLQEGVVNNVGISMPSPIGQAVFHDLVEISIVTASGDSGSPVVNNALKIAGIIVGGTPSVSYMIPMDIILDTFKCDLLS